MTVLDGIYKWMLKAHANKFPNAQASASNNHASVAAAEHELTYAEQADYRGLTYAANYANATQTYDSGTFDPGNDR